MRAQFLLMSIILGLSLSSCANFRAEDHTGRVCKALADDIYFEPQTADIRRSEIAETNLPLAEHDYDVAGCND